MGWGLPTVPFLPSPGVHVFGLCATALVTDVIQLATGYHAPFFLTVCKPNYTLLGTPCDANPYITQDICSGTDKHAILSARYVPGEPCATLPALLPRPNHVPSPCRKTFPSQHATLSAFAAVYVSVSSLHCLAHAGLGQPWAAVSLSCGHRQALPNIAVPVVGVCEGTCSPACTQQLCAWPGHD